MSKIFSLPVQSLFISRIVYTINWFNISSIFYLISSDFGEDISLLGYITSSFVIGVGLFQIPAGLLSTKVGIMKMAAFGILFSSFMSLLTGLTNDSYQLMILRFFVGIGMACFFAPSFVLISKLLGNNSHGFGIGLLNSAHAIGGILGVFGWVIIGEFIGWRSSLFLSGILGLLCGIFLVLILKNYNSVSFTKIKLNIHEIRNILFHRSFIILGITLLSFQIGAILLLTFVIFYLVNDLQVHPTYAGIIAGLSFVVGIFSSPIFGKIYDRISDPKNLLFFSSIISAICISLLYFDSILITIFSILISSIFLSAGFVIVYAKTKQISHHSNPKYQTLAISHVNSIGLSGSFFVPYLFSYFVNNYGYSISWFLGGIIIIIFSIPILKFKS
ncbi:MAG: MFS transporter [Nitrososphaeraceae archaeon]